MTHNLEEKRLRDEHEEDRRMEAMSTYRPLSDEVIATLQHSVIRPADLRTAKEQCRRANRLAAILRAEGEGMLVEQALRAYLGENADD